MEVANLFDKLLYKLDAGEARWRADPGQIYGFHLENVLRCLAEELGPVYHRFTFLIYEHRIWKPIPDFPVCGKDVILIFLSDEKSTVPAHLCDQFFAIFKAYYPLEENHRNMLAFPVGYSNSSSLTRFIPFQERAYDSSYAGNFLSNRLDFYRSFNLWKFFPPFPIQNAKLRLAFFKFLEKSRLYRPVLYRDVLGKGICYWSGGFAKGLARAEYAEIISNTRIALCPKGFISTECFRLFETMRLGCVIIADELPPSRWYRGSPIIVEKDWLHIAKVVGTLLAEPDSMLAIHKATLAWWDKVCSDEAVARHLATGIQRLMAEERR